MTSSVNQNEALSLIEHLLPSVVKEMYMYLLQIDLYRQIFKGVNLSLLMINHIPGVVE